MPGRSSAVAEERTATAGSSAAPAARSFEYPARTASATGAGITSVANTSAIRADAASWVSGRSGSTSRAAATIACCGAPATAVR